MVDVSGVQLARISERAKWSDFMLLAAAHMLLAAAHMLCVRCDVYNVSLIYVPRAALKEEYR